jgi:hypothetical protein
MKATDIIRNVLDLIDEVSVTHPDSSTSTAPSNTSDTFVDADSEESRFRQILAQLTHRDTPCDYDNSPNEVVSGYAAVTTDAGGGLNGPKHPDDIRVKDPRQGG